jgi:hypothetical protein
MQKGILWLIVGPALGLILGACTLGPPETPTPLVPTTTLTPAVPTATAVPPTATAPADPNAAPPFAEVKAALRQITARLDSSGSNREQVEQEIRSYTEGLRGKTVYGWDAWVAGTRRNDDGSYAASLYLDDPYAPEPTPTASPGPYAGGLPTAYIEKAPAGQAGGLRAGQHVRVSGAITAFSAWMWPEAEITLDLTRLEPVATTAFDPGTPPPLGPPATLPPGGPPPTATPGPDSAPSWAAIAAAVAPLQGSERTRYIAGLDGKQVADWQGWVTGVDDQGAAISMDDPYSTAPVPTPPPGNRMEAFDPPLYVRLELAAASAPALRLGQKVRFSGSLKQSETDYNPVLRLANASATMIEDRLAGLTAPADLADVEIRLRRTACFGTCPVYVVTAYGNGVVVWQGEGHVAVRGTRITTVGTGALRQLLAEFEKAGYFALKDEYNEYTVTDNPSALTFLKRGGRSKSIDHYYGDRTAPARLLILERRIDEILNTGRWIE